jgi:hypothetical protein
MLKCFLVEKRSLSHSNPYIYVRADDNFFCLIFYHMYKLTRTLSYLSLCKEWNDKKRLKCFKTLIKLIYVRTYLCKSDGHNHFYSVLKTSNEPGQFAE